uniref:3'(2'),5'-bisphosphate nucleotidase 1 n=1 Tax=Gongylonema pulchrum TaxID=637853 RepID=A0A183E3R7_9BILA
LRGVKKSYSKGPASLRDLYTDADIAAQDCIISSLHRQFGEHLRIIGEERLQVVIWVDPLDGTYELVAAEGNTSRQQEVTVLIGVAHKGRPIAGVIHQPFWGADASGRTIWAIKGAGVHGIEVAKGNLQRYVVTTRSHSTPQVRDTLNLLREKNLISDVEFVGGAGFKVLKCLEGAAAYVFASPGCKKWDTCAPEAVITESGGRLTDIAGNDLYYGEDAPVPNSGGVLATAHWVNHQEFVDCIPETIKSVLPELERKSSAVSSSSRQ